MTPLKDTLEAVESTGSQANKAPKPDAGQLRADAVSLDVPVKIHGSRVTDVVLGVTPHTEPFEEMTSTLIIFPQGGVLRMSTVVSVGQVVVLTNLKSGKDAICRVAKVRACPNNQNYVEVEFTHRQPGYWGVLFSSDAPELAKKTVTADVEPARVSVIRQSESNVNPVRPPASPSEEPATLSSLESTFISIGSQESVQPAAASTTGAKGGDPFAILSEVDRTASTNSKKSTVTNFPAPAIPTPSPLRSVAELRRDVQSAHGVPVSASAENPVPELPSDDLDLFLPAEESTSGHARSPLGNFSSKSTVDSGRPAPRDLFSSHLESSVSENEPQAAGPRKNWVLIAACAAAVLVTTAGGAYYFQSAHTRPNSAATNAGSSDGSEGSANSAPQPAQQANMVSSARPSTVPTAREVVVVHADPAPVAKSAKAAPEPTPAPSEAIAVATPTAPAKSQSSRPVSNLFGSLNAHPAATRRPGSSPSDVAPTLDPGLGAGADSSALNSAAQVMSALPKPVPEGPLEVGGNVMAPKVISSVPPIYPPIAVQMQVSGTVVVEAIIDKSGNVAEAKAVSGPQLLRQSALDALRRWKYQPSVVNGQPVAVHMSVAIQFRR